MDSARNAHSTKSKICIMEEQFQKRSFLDSKTVDLERFRFGIAPEAGRQARNDRFYIIERSIWNIFDSGTRRRPGGRPETIVF